MKKIEKPFFLSIVVLLFMLGCSSVPHLLQQSVIPPALFTDVENTIAHQRCLLVR